jgi:3-oxoacyl-[acyl-carrier-protein] synthase-3
VAVPDRIVTNADFEKTLDTSDQWIVERTGIRERRIAGPADSVASLSKTAAERAMTLAGVSAGDLDAIVLGTATPDRLLPSTACDLQALLGADRAAAFDISAACPGFIYAMTIAEALIAAEQGRTILVIGAEKLSTITDMTDRSTAILFGDAAGAAIIQRVEGGDRGILSTFIKSDGKLANLLYRPGGGSADPISEKVVRERSHFIKMAGREVFKSAVLAMSDACDQASSGPASARIRSTSSSHQANIRIIEATAKHAVCRWTR